MKPSFSLFGSILMVTAVVAALTGCRDSPVEADPCRTHVLVGGVDDNFASGDVEQAAPSPELMNYMLANYYNPYLFHRFDQTQIDRPVGHTFQLPGVDALHPVTVRKAVFTMRVKALGSALHNDWFHLMIDDDNGSVLGIYDASLAALNGGSWQTGNTQLVTLDLGALGLLDRLSNGVLHMYLQDDTAVDFVKLEVEYCGTCGGYDPVRDDV